MAPGSSGLGKATVGKSGSGVELLGHDRRARPAGALERGEQRRGADAVHRRVGDGDVRSAGRRRTAGTARR